MVPRVYKRIFANKQLVIELGTMAQLSMGSVIIRYGDSVVLTTLNYNETVNNHDFFPLTVVFQEKLYSVGRIPGGFLKREGFAGEYATICARLIDRSIRPLFTKGFFNEVQIINNVFALDENSDVRFAAALGTSLALSLSGLPFNGPSASVIIGMNNNELIVNPTNNELINGKLELIVSGTKEAVNMVEASCKNISEKQMLLAIKLAHDNIIDLISFQEKIINEIKPKGIDYTLITIPEQIINFLKKYEPDILNLSKITSKNERSFKFKKITIEAKTDFLETEIRTNLLFTDEIISHYVHVGLEKLLKKIMRHQILATKKRIDGRNFDEIRSLTASIDILPIVHGSAIFSRGDTQVMSVLTLGTLNEHQIIDDLGKVNYKRFMHHYNFPPFSVGETGRIGKPSRREIGHGALGEKALSQILPSSEEFPYTIRMVSEVLASNGSTSQAAICAASLALMAGGVPITEAIAGIAMGLIKQDKEYAILTDIQGLEDHLGDMDFKVAGTKSGICALQMDIKINGIDTNIMEDALEKARLARLEIISTMNSTISVPKKILAKSAPKVFQQQLPVDKIREVIGAGGKVINKIINDCDNVKIDIEDNGKITLYHYDQNTIDKAWEMINNIVNPKQPEVGEEFKGKIVKITNFGAFASIKDNIDGLIHISEFAKLFNKKIDNLASFVKINSTFKVKIKNIDVKNNKISLEIIS